MFVHFLLKCVATIEIKNLIPKYECPPSLACCFPVSAVINYHPLSNLNNKCSPSRCWRLEVQPPLSLGLHSFYLVQLLEVPASINVWSLPASSKHVTPTSAAIITTDLTFPSTDPCGHLRPTQMIKDNLSPQNP